MKIQKACQKVEAGKEQFFANQHETTRKLVNGYSLIVNGIEPT